jgi:cholesterol transport system auxiliary component
MKSPGVYPSFFLLCMVALSMIPVSCVSLKREYPEQVYHVISIDRPGETGLPAVPDSVLQVMRCRISPRYKNSELVYRIDEYSYESDFYNKYFIQPQDMISEEVTHWFQDSAVAGVVIPERSPLTATHVLTGNIISLYGDYRDGWSPEAVMTIQFLVTRDNLGNNEVIFQKKYEERVALNERTAESLVTGLNEALVRILTGLEKDLREAVGAGESGKVLLNFPLSQSQSKIIS